MHLQSWLEETGCNVGANPALALGSKPSCPVLLLMDRGLG